MVDEKYLINVSDFNPKLFNMLRRNLMRNNLPLTLEGLKTFGLKNLYDFDKVVDVIDPMKLDIVLKVLERNNIHLTITEEDFNNIEFDILMKNCTFKERLHETLSKHNAFEEKAYMATQNKKEKTL